jgi:hypothetical protein
MTINFNDLEYNMLLYNKSVELDKETLENRKERKNLFSVLG